MVSKLDIFGVVKIKLGDVSVVHLRALEKAGLVSGSIEICCQCFGSFQELNKLHHSCKSAPQFHLGGLPFKAFANGQVL